MDLKFWHDGCDVYVAESPEHATALFNGNTGMDHDKMIADDDAEPWHEIHIEPGKTISVFDEELNAKVSKTREEWLAEGSGFFGATEY